MKIKFDAPYKQYSPYHNLVMRVTNRWTMTVLYHMSKNDVPLRFSQLQRLCHNVSAKVLTNALQSLVADGIVERKESRNDAVLIEYSLTERGRTFIPVMMQVFSWAYKNLSVIKADREKYIRENHDEDEMM